MGLEVDRCEFAEAEYVHFGERLVESLEALRMLLARPGFGAGPPTLGAELEVSLVDAAGRPLPRNRAVLAETGDPRLTVELDRFNLESNLRHGPLAGRPFSALAQECEETLAELSRAAALHGGRVAVIGILPTLRASDLAGHMMTDSMRYRALSAGLRRLRREPFSLDIHGEDDLELRAEDVTWEGAATSFQVHLRVSPEELPALYNAVQLATAPVLAVAGNSPTFLGRRLWDETRVALFKQAVDPRPRGGVRSESRVGFGTAWVEDAHALFAENVYRHPPLLPVLDDEAPAERLAAGATPALRELRLHQGTVWHWNRAIYDPAEGGHLRIELRALPAGPTVQDMMANAALHVGLARILADAGTWRGMPFEAAHSNFYRAAQRGLDAELSWPAGPEGPVRAIGARALLEALLPEAQRGLERLGVEADEARGLLAHIQARVRSGRTGARWQRDALAAAERRRPREEALAAMLEAYLEQASSGAVVGAWSEPRG